MSEFINVAEIIEDEEAQREAQADLGQQMDEQAATKMLRRIAAKERDLEVLVAQCNAIISDARKNLSQYRAWAEPQLEQFAIARLHAQGNRSRTLKTIGGNISFRTQPESFSVADKTAAMAEAALVCPDTITSKLVPTILFDSARYKELAIAHFRDTGEVYPGIERKPEHQAMKISFEADSKPGKEGQSK